MAINNFAFLRDTWKIFASVCWKFSLLQHKIDEWIFYKKWLISVLQFHHYDSNRAKYDEELFGIPVQCWINVLKVNLCHVTFNKLLWERRHTLDDLGPPGHRGVALRQSWRAFWIVSSVVPGWLIWYASKENKKQSFEEEKSENKENSLINESTTLLASSTKDFLLFRPSRLNWLQTWAVANFFIILRTVSNMVLPPRAAK